MHIFWIGLLSLNSLATDWMQLQQDGLHDQDNQGLKLLQQPSEALSVLPKDTAGNNVNWVKALRDGYIKPRSSLLDNPPLPQSDIEVLMKDTGEMAMVLFPHKVHTEWLDCANCHDHLFARKAGATPVNMFAILQGKYCGNCHGAVAFPLTECDRCHSVPRKDPKRKTSRGP